MPELSYLYMQSSFDAINCHILVSQTGKSFTIYPDNTVHNKSERAQGPLKLNEPVLALF